MSKPADIAKNIIQKRQSQMAKSEKIQVDSKKMLEEHRKLVRILRSPSHKDDLEEAEEQEKSLKDYEKINKSLKPLLMAGAMGAASMAAPSQVSQNQSSQLKAPPGAVEVAKQAEIKPPDRKHLLESIKFVESSGGKNFNHPVVQHGMNKGDKALGSFAFMPKTVHELVGKSKKLSQKYPDALQQTDQASMESYFKAKPEFENDLANHYLDRIAKETKAKTPGDYHTAWEHGIGGLNNMHAKGKDMSTVERWNKGEAAYNHAKKAHDNRVSLNLSKPKE